MAAPTFVNAGSFGGQSANTTVTLPLPASRVNGNLLLAVVSFGQADKVPTLSWPSGWTPLISLTGIDAFASSAVAYRVVNGSEVNVVLTWTGLTDVEGRIFQYSGVFSSSPIGATHATRNAGNSTSVSEAGVTVQRNNSLVAVIFAGGQSTETWNSGPSGYTIDAAWTQVGVGGAAEYSQTTPSVAGNASTAVSITMNSAHRYSCYSIEVTSESANTAPVVSTSAAITYYQDDPATAIATDITVTDADSANMASGTVSITANFSSSQDVLGFTNQNGITGSYNSGTGVLTLSGSATKANYQTALRSVTYENVGASPTSNVRTVSFQVNDGSANSNTDTATVSVQAITPGSTLTTTPGAGSTTCPPYWALEVEIWAGGQGGDNYYNHGNLGLLTTCSTFGLTANPASISFGQGAFYWGYQAGLPGSSSGGDVNLPGQRGGSGGKYRQGGPTGEGTVAVEAPVQGGSAPFGGAGGAPPVAGIGFHAGHDGAAPGGGGSGTVATGYGLAWGGFYSEGNAGGTAGSYCKKRFVRGAVGAPAFGSTINFNIGAGGAAIVGNRTGALTTYAGAGANGGIRITVFGFDDLAPGEGGDSDTSNDPIDLGVGHIEIISPVTPPREGDTLQADYQGDDPDSSTGYSTNITFRWLADGVAISGATATHYTIGGGEVGKVITVEATYTDAKGFRDVTTSDATAAVLVRPLPLDDISMDDVFSAHSVKLLRRAYTGPLVRLFHGSTNNEQDFYPAAGTDHLDHDEILAWRVSEGREFNDTCYATVYDQTGHGWHISGLLFAHAFAPRYAPYGDTITHEPPYALPSGYPAPLFDGSRDLQRAAVLGPTSALGFFAVVMRDDSEPGRVFRWDYSGDTAQEVGFRITNTAAADWPDNAAAFYGHGVTAGAGPRAVANGPYDETDDDAVIWEGELSSSHRAIRRNGVTQALSVNVAATFTPVASGKLVVGPNNSTNTKTAMMAELVIFNNDIHGALGPLRLAAAQAFLVGDISAPTADDLSCTFTDDGGWSVATVTVTIPFVCHFTDDDGWSEATLTISLAYSAKFQDDEGMTAIATVTVKEQPPPVQTVVITLGAG
jgi:hypothetical protein